MLKIWGRSSSSNVQKVLWAADELGLAYERVDLAGPYGGNREPAYLAINPNGLVPMLEDDGYVLWESNSILRYLDRVHGGGRLCPTGPRAQGHAEQWMDWQLSALAPAVFNCFIGLVRTKPEDRDLAAIHASAAKTGELLGMLDDWLATRPYVAGDAFSYGDIPVGIITYRFYTLEIERPELPNLAAWYRRLGGRPAYRQHVMIKMI